MSLTSRLDKIAAALGPSAESPARIAMVGADGIARRPGGQVIDLDAVPPGVVQVVLHRGEPAPPRLASVPLTDPPPANDQT